MAAKKSKERRPTVMCLLEIFGALSDKGAMDKHEITITTTRYGQPVGKIKTLVVSGGTGEYVSSVKAADKENGVSYTIHVRKGQGAG